jgi:hypothetical protein
MANGNGTTTRVLAIVGGALTVILGVGGALYAVPSRSDMDRAETRIEAADQRIHNHETRLQVQEERWADIKSDLTEIKRALRPRKGDQE